MFLNYHVIACSDEIDCLKNSIFDPNNPNLYPFRISMTATIPIDIVLSLNNLYLVTSLTLMSSNLCKVAISGS